MSMSFVFSWSHKCRPTPTQVAQIHTWDTNVEQVLVLCDVTTKVVVNEVDNIYVTQQKLIVGKLDFKLQEYKVKISQNMIKGWFWYFTTGPFWWIESHMFYVNAIIILVNAYLRISSSFCNFFYIKVECISGYYCWRMAKMRYFCRTETNKCMILNIIQMFIFQTKY